MLLKKKFFGKKEKFSKTLLTAGLLGRSLSPLPQPSRGVALHSVLRCPGILLASVYFQFTASLSSYFTEWKTEV